MTVSRHIRFGTVQYMTTRTTEDIYQGIEYAVKLYNKGGFNVTTILADPEFKCHKKQLKENMI